MDLKQQIHIRNPTYLSDSNTCDGDLGETLPSYSLNSFSKTRAQTYQKEFFYLFLTLWLTDPHNCQTKHVL